MKGCNFFWCRLIHELGDFMDLVLGLLLRSWLVSVRWRINRSQVFYLWYSCSEKKKKKKKKKQIPEVFYKKSPLKNFAKFIVKYLCRSLFFNKVASVRTATLFKKRLQHRYFPVTFAKFFGILFLQNTLGRLLLWKVLQNHYENTCNGVPF